MREYGDKAGEAIDPEGGKEADSAVMSNRLQLGKEACCLKVCRPLCQGLRPVAYFNNLKNGFHVGDEAMALEFWKRLGRPALLQVIWAGVKAEDVVGQEDCFRSPRLHGACNNLQIHARPVPAEFACGVEHFDPQ